MSIQAAVHHVTRYRYDRPISLGPQTIRLRPAPHCRSKVVAYALTIEPEQHFLNWQQDPQSNWLARVVIPEKTDHFTVTVDLTVEMDVINPFDFFLEPSAEQFPFAYAPDLKAELEPYLQPAELGEGFKSYLAKIPRDPTQTTNFISDLNAKLSHDIGYVIRMEPGIQTPEDTLCKGTGSCRDSAWLLVQLLRHLGLAARFASGYLIQLTPDVKSLDGPSGTAVDFTDLHAWCEVYLPGAGWVGLDPTSGLFAGEGHIPLACTASPSQAAPISGAVEPAEVLFDFDMTVTRVKETPRVTKPYTGEQWVQIEALGDEVDRILTMHDVRLTMGGEPTFVSIDDRSGAEWHTAAVGPTKRALADTLIRRLRDRFATGGLLHYGQGKWYPGESLPRWAFALYWRTDGVPMWKSAERIATERANYRPTAEDARALTEAIATRLGLATSYAIPAYEDFWHHLREERALADNVTPRDSKLEDPELRARLARVFERGITQAVGYVLPIEKGLYRWLSEHWKTRSGNIFLLPGDSAIGFRLPLNSLPYVAPEARSFVPPPDPFAPLPPPEPRDTSGQSYTNGHLAGEVRPEPFKPVKTAVNLTAEPAVRTAMTVEPRDGRLCVFMPPTTHADDYFALLGVVEDCAEALDVALHIEGYPPPFDPRINVIKVTPDPGVIEVNIHPAKNWREQVDITKALYEEAAACRLSTEKFLLDGRHTGTGGGNHIVVGAQTPPDSPFLRRPDLLKSLVAYWQNHPALSYMFSGMFIGPTSQAPRIDEARHEALYELEIAFKEVPPRSASNIPPWLVDRIFRNLLADSTGNTHRTEICIDKLYSPDGPNGRLGLVEFRGFEMPPHAEMSLAQQLLMRALIARFWREPYHGELVRWGTMLQDRFMLPHFVWSDFQDVIADMNDHGFAFQAEWFKPHWEFRFPHIGAVQYGDVQLELRTALEPWNVMAEEGTVGGTVRFVDSSVERLEATLTGLTPGRHKLLVNGRAAPLRTTAQGAAVAGIRFKAWKPAHGLHPTIPADAPLVIEVWDSWTKRSIGGCTYHVAHPGGRNFEIFPVNANEAEGRRLARFEPFGFTGGSLRGAAGRTQSRIPNHSGPEAVICVPGSIDSVLDVAEPVTAPTRFDELRDGEGLVRPHWRAFARTLSQLSPEEFERRQASARATVQDNGVTYNVYDDRDGKARPWQLDIVPFILSASDWSRIEAAIIQRATLADLVLRDVYGPQRLVREGVLPPHLVTGHPQFLRPLRGTTPAGGIHVHLYSADLARSPDGSWRVMASRADAPAGLGYALENRLVVAQTFPENFADMRVARLAAFFNAYKESVLALGTSRRDRAVLLTPGPYNEAYFEHVYLAHYLGLTLVQGDDLSVRDGEVFIKTLTGLDRVSAIFRRVDSDFCDPLEFRGDSALGVPGLVEAVRAGGVVLANALGGGVIESPAMDAYLPAAARALLGEDLKIPDIATIWCGTEWGRKEALSRMGSAILRDAFDARPMFSRHSSARLGSDMSRGGTRVGRGPPEAARRDAGAAGDFAFGTGAGVRRRQVRGPAREPARLRRLDPQWLDGDAGRTDPRRCG